MHKLAGVFAVLLLAACGTAGPGSGGVPTVSIPPSAAGAALAQLCSDTGDASMTGLATKLDAFDPSTMDTTEFQLAAGAVASSLAQLQVSPDKAVLREAAVTAVESIQGNTVDKTTATQAATAIRALDTAIC